MEDVNFDDDGAAIEPVLCDNGGAVTGGALGLEPPRDDDEGAALKLRARGSVLPCLCLPHIDNDRLC